MKSIIARIRIRTSQTDLFEPGEVITGLSDEEYQELIDSELAKEVEGENTENTGDDLEKLTKKELLELAFQMNIETVKESMSKAEIIVTIKGA